MDEERLFDEYIAVDYSGSGPRDTGAEGVAVYQINLLRSEEEDVRRRIVPVSVMGDPNEESYERMCELAEDFEFKPSFRQKTRWRRDELTLWLFLRLTDGETRTLVGLDHGFSWPDIFFERELGGADLCWEERLAYVSHLVDCHERPHAVMERSCASEWFGNSAGDVADSQEINETDGVFRLTELRARENDHQPESVFSRKMYRSVAYSTIAGMKELKVLREQLERAGKLRGGDVEFWPFDSKQEEIGRPTSMVAEIYPAIYKEWPDGSARRDCPGGDVPEDLSHHEFDALISCRWMEEQDRNGGLKSALEAPLTFCGKSADFGKVEREGWILGCIRPDS